MTSKIFKFISILILNIFIFNYVLFFTVGVQAKDLEPPKTEPPKEVNLDLSVNNVGIKSATFSWVYPEGMNFKMGDYINLIVFESSVGNNGQIPIFSVAHNMDNVNLKSVTTFEAKSLSPSTKYTAQIELMKSTGEIYKSEAIFETKKFEIYDINFQNSQNNKISKKNVRLFWDVSHSNIEFEDGDGIQIFMKKSSDSDFSKKPIFETKENINRADIELPNFEESYDFKIVYNIGTKKIESDKFFLDAKASGLNFKITDVTINSAKLTWDFIDKEILNNDSQLQIFVKEDNDIEYDESQSLVNIKGKDELLKNKTYSFTKLKFNTKYNLKVKFIIEKIDELGRVIPIFIEEQYEFKTKNIELKDVKIENTSGNKCNVSWNYKGEGITFSNEDKLTISIKESSEEEYSQTILTISKDLLSTKTKEITLPKYNTKYDIKVNLAVGDRDVVEYITHSIEVPEGIFKIKEIKDDSLKIESTFNSKTKFENGDKIKIFAKKSTENDYNTTAVKEVELSSQNLSASVEIKIEDLKTVLGLKGEDEDKIYNFKINVIKSGSVFQEKIYTVKMIADILQIVNVSFKNKDEKEVEAIVEYAPYDYDFVKNEVESLTLSMEKSKNSKKSSVTQYKEQKITSNFKTNNKFNIKFDEFATYKLKFVYNFKKKNGTKKKRVVSKTNKPLTTPPSIDTGPGGGPGLSPSPQPGGSSGPSVAPPNGSVGGSSGGGTQNGNSATIVTQQLPVVREEIYNHNFDVFLFESVDVFLSKLKFRFSFDKSYKLKNGDKVEIFAKREDENNLQQDPVAIFEHGKNEVNLKEMSIFDLVGFDCETDYTFEAVFTSVTYPSNPIKKQVKVKTIDMNIQNVKVEHLGDVSAIIRWKLGRGFEFSPADVLKIYYKKEDESDFPRRPNETVKDIDSQNGVFLYLPSVDERYDIKLVFESGKKTSEHSFKLSTDVGHINMEIKEIHQTSAYINWNYPENYLTVDGESVSVFIKESNQAMYKKEPDYFMRQNSEKSEFLENFKGVKLSGLLPNTSYDVKVFQDFGKVGNREAEFSFKTEDIILSDLKVIALKPLEFEVMWKLNSDMIDFNEEYDSLDIYMKSPEEAWNEKNRLYSVSRGLDYFNEVRFAVKDKKSTYDVKIEYSLANKQISQTISTGLFYIEYSELEYTEKEFGKIEVMPKYVSSIDLKDGDEIFVFVSKPKVFNYEQKFYAKYSSATDMNSLRNIPLKEIQQTSSIAAYIKSKSVVVFPSEIIYDTRAQNSSTLTIVSELKGAKIHAELPKDYELDKKVPLVNSIGGEARYETLKDGTEVIVIDKVVPGKKYKKTVITATDVNGKPVELFIEEFTLEPTNLLEEFLRNAYYFAFDREPDESGYNYWKGKLEEKGEVTGRYFLVNLMFAEKEFSDRNLNDDELIKVLYQIVVNRKYDAKGLSYWTAIYKQYLTKFNGDKYQAKKTIVTRMVNEQEFGRLCKQMNIKW